MIKADFAKDSSRTRYRILTPRDQSWPRRRLKWICRLQYGDSLLNPSGDEGDFVVYGSNGGFGSSSRKNMRAPAIVVGRKGSYGKVTYAPDGGFCSDTAFFVDGRSSKVKLRWLYYALEQAGLDRFSQDTGVPGLSRDAAHQVDIPVPSLEIQEGIAHFLDCRTIALDALLKKKHRMLELLIEKRSAVIFQTVTKGLDRKVRTRSSGIESIGAIPAHWNVVPLMWLTPTFRQIMYGIVLPGPDVENGVPIVKGGDVMPDRLRVETLSKTTVEIEAGFVRSRLAPGDVVYAIRGSIGMAALVPADLAGANITQDVARISPRDGINSKWLLYAVQSMSFFGPVEARARGATIRGINIWDLKRSAVVVPPESEQGQIADCLDRETSSLDALIRKIRSSIEYLEEYRAAIVTAAVAGEIDMKLLARS